MKKLCFTINIYLCFLTVYSSDTTTLNYHYNYINVVDSIELVKAGKVVGLYLYKYDSDQIKDIKTNPINFKNLVPIESIFEFTDATDILFPDTIYFVNHEISTIDTFAFIIRITENKYFTSDITVHKNGYEWWGTYYLGNNLKVCINKNYQKNGQQVFTKVYSYFDISPRNIKREILTICDIEHNYRLGGDYLYRNGLLRQIVCNKEGYGETFPWVKLYQISFAYNKKKQLIKKETTPLADKETLKSVRLYSYTNGKLIRELIIE